MKMSGAPPLTPGVKEQFERRIFQLQWDNLKELEEELKCCNAEESANIWNKLGDISGVHYVTI